MCRPTVEGDGFRHGRNRCGKGSPVRWSGLFAIGFAQSLAMISMGAVLLMVTAPAYRGRVMGVRMLAVYDMPLGLLAGGALIEWFGVRFQILTFAVAGLVLFGCAVAVTRGRWLGTAATPAGSGPAPRTPAASR